MLAMQGEMPPEGDKYELFMEWFKKEGGICPKAEYPAYFENGLLGWRAKEDIHYKEAFLYVPLKMVIRVETARKDPDL